MALVFPTRKLIIRAANMLRARGSQFFRATVLELGLEKAVGTGTVEEQSLRLAEYVLDNRDELTEEGVKLPDAVIALAHEAFEYGQTYYVTSEEREAFETAYEEGRQRQQMTESAPSENASGAADFTPVEVATAFDGSRAVGGARLGPIGSGRHLPVDLVGPLATVLNSGVSQPQVFDLYAPYGLDNVPQFAQDVRASLDIALRESDRIGFQHLPKDHNQRPPDILTDETARATAYEAIQEIETLDVSAPDAQGRAAAAGGKLKKIARQIAEWVAVKFDEGVSAIVKEVAKKAAAEALYGYLASLAGFMWRLAMLVMEFWKD